MDPAVFGGLVGDVFAVAGEPPADPTLVLEAVTEFAPAPGAPRRQPFTLTFVGSPGDFLPQATYTLEHSDLGPVEIFLVPRGPGEDSRHRYDAVFN